MRAQSLSIALAIVLFAVAGVVTLVVPVNAAPPRLNCASANAAITAPASGATLSGIVQIEGNAALGGQFQYYKLEVSPDGRDAFNTIGGLVRQQVNGGQLGVWDSASVPDGTYQLRLRVVDPTGNYCEATVGGLRVQNSAPVQPTDTPTPVETEATPEFSVVPTAVPTINIPGGEFTSGSAQATAQPTGSATQSASGSSSSLPGGINIEGITSALGEALSGYVRAFIFGALAMAGILLLIGVIFYVRRVL